MYGRLLGLNFFLMRAPSSSSITLTRGSRMATGSANAATSSFSSATAGSVSTPRRCWTRALSTCLMTAASERAECTPRSDLASESTERAVATLRASSSAAPPCFRAAASFSRWSSFRFSSSCCSLSARRLCRRLLARVRRTARLRASFASRTRMSRSASVSFSRRRSSRASCRLASSSSPSASASSHSPGATVAVSQASSPFSSAASAWRSASSSASSSLIFCCKFSIAVSTS
mmetsp:Transcript_8539/g.26814  ORF Transcript_8539/g.26814 Transcript_8539/m.26814 type:complete len:233 (-) Transcript_8539:901-1599(-)